MGIPRTKPCRRILPFSYVPSIHQVTCNACDAMFTNMNFLTHHTLYSHSQHPGPSHRPTMLQRSDRKWQKLRVRRCFGLRNHRGYVWETEMIGRGKMMMKDVQSMESTTCVKFDIEFNKDIGHCHGVTARVLGPWHCDSKCTLECEKSRCTPIVRDFQ